jgi:hypothetical protein
MNNNLVLAFAKNAAAYFKQAGETIDKAYEVIGESLNTAEQLSEINPAIITKLASLTRLNGTTFLPDGMEKQAADGLSVHQTTAKILDQVLDECAIIKQAYDQLTASRPSLGSVSNGNYPAQPQQQKQAYALDSDEQPQSFQNFNRRVLEANI